MDFLGVGPLELFFILIIALIVLGPKDMVKAGQTLGRFFRNLTKSEAWSTIRQTAREVRTLPTRLMRESGADDLPSILSDVRKDLSSAGSELSNAQKQYDLSDWTSPQHGSIAPPGLPSIQSRDKPPAQIPGIEDWGSVPADTSKDASAPETPAPSPDQE